MVCGVFPGQGSQYVGMGRDLYNGSRRAMRLYDSVYEVCGIDVSGISFDGLPKEQSDPLNSQLITFVNSYVIYDRVKDSVDFDAFAGYSLGEMTALCAAGVFGRGDGGFRNGVRIVAKRGEIMKKYSFEESCLISIRGCGRKEVEEFCESTNGDLVVALYCSPTTHVIGGHPESIRKWRKKISGRRLKVNGPYHTGHYGRAAKEFREFLRGVRFEKPSVPVIANCNGEPYSFGTIADNMGNQLCNPVLWDKGILGIDAESYVEMGPGESLTIMAKEILRNPKCASVQGLEDIGRI